ncbi:hypothetical protein NKI82_20230 [Mesorhizobium sp. M0482]|uniref:hypothetical protein n=1 Tax=unclassified Mesorhizobium TaxID=325217 RepID=UPI00333C9209
MFLANEIETEINQKLGQEGDPLIAASIRCTPGPTTRFLMYGRIVLLDMRRPTFKWVGADD